MPQETARLATVAEAVAYSGKGERTIRRWIADGALRSYRVGVGRGFVRVDLNDLDRLIQPTEQEVRTEATA